MLNIDIIAGGSQKDPAYNTLIEEYIRRLNWPINIYDINVNLGKKTSADQTKKAELNAFEKYIDTKSYIIALDEHGKNLDSISFASQIQKIQEELGYQKIQFLIGGAFGLHNDLLQKSHMKLCFGALTWPHLMVRLMLTEQLYRAQQIQAGHPYHKE
jgi:23S rRNA (pseudouridine1915-N3)-methyltransferase